MEKKNVKYLTVKDLKKALENLPDDTLLVEGNTFSWCGNHVTPITTLTRFLKICEANSEDTNWEIGDYNVPYVPIEKTCLMVYDTKRTDY